MIRCNIFLRFYFKALLLFLRVFNHKENLRTSGMTLKLITQYIRNTYELHFIFYHQLTLKDILYILLLLSFVYLY